MHLLIISHTEHFFDSQGFICGWGPTVREINFLSKKFDHITHLGVLHKGLTPGSCIPYESENISFIPLPRTGGKTFLSKIKSLGTIPAVIKKVNESLRLADAVQIRVPTGMANFLFPYFTFRKNKPLVWVKYAGNWKQEKAPMGYRFQRWWLTKNYLNCKVTINGKWDDQPAHCKTFENPCLDDSERAAGKIIIENKNYQTPYVACFIGRIEVEKGVKRIIDALKEFGEQQITTIHFIGDGKDRATFEALCGQQSTVKCIFHGSLRRDKIPELIASSHFLILPSTASEGFPKVIAEGANYGAIPIVSDISSISQYINDKNGFTWEKNTDFSQWLKSLVLNPDDLQSKSIEGYKFADYFTFENYYRKMVKEILNDN